MRGAARKWGVEPDGYLARTTDTTVKAVTFEDAAALVGLVLAALGLFLEQMTGDPLWDGVAAIAIGLLLLVVAFVLARANKSLLIGQSASPRIEAGAQGGDRRARARRRRPAAAHLGDRPREDPGRRQGGLRRQPRRSADIERIADEAEQRLVARHEGVRYVFLDPTAGRRPRPRRGAPPATTSDRAHRNA